MKIVGIIVLAVGVGIAASAGARLSPGLEEQVTLKGAAGFREAETQAALEAYCAALSEAGFPAVGECDGEEPPAGAEEETAQDPGKAVRGVLTDERVLELLRSGELPPEVGSKRAAWLAAKARSDEAAAAAAEVRAPGPGARVEQWASRSGGLFAIGLLLIVGGAVLARIAIKREATHETPEKVGRAAGVSAQDFGKVLDGIEEKVRALADEAKSVEAPQREDFDRIKAEIETLQLEGFGRLVGAAGRIQNKYGMAGFAAIFSPLSAAERKVNRAWSTLVDRHWPEMTDSLSGAATDLAEARQVLASLTSQ